MELRHLRYLIAVAEERTFVAAASRLQLAQPALSRQIRDLETELGTELFARETSGTKLTSAGETCVRAAHAILEDVRVSTERARLAERGLVGKCVMGAGRYPLWNGLLARVVEMVRVDYPGLEMVVEEHSTQAQWKALAEAEIDVAFGTAPPSEYPQFTIETHSLDVLDSIVVAKSHHLASRDAVSLKELEPETWIRYAPAVADEPTRNMQAVLNRIGFSPSARRHAANADSLRMLVRAGAGWSPLPRSMRSVLGNGLVAIPLTDLAVPFRYVHMHRRGESRPAILSVLRALRRSAQHEGLGGEKEPPSGIRALAGTCVAGPEEQRLELRHLRYFAAIVENETIGRAAEQLDLTQPALSRQLRDLEEIVGVALLTRGARGVVPTLAGESLYSDAVRILRVADQMAPEAQRALRGTAGDCLVGLVASPMVWDMVTQAAANCAARLPDINFAVEDVPTPRQAKALREARIDVALGHRYPTVPDLDPNIVRELLLPDAMNVALVSAHHPLASKREIALRELGDVPFLFMQRDFSPAFYDFIMSAFERAHYTPVVNAEYDGLPTVWTLAAQGMGWCLGSTSQIEYPPHGLTAVRIRDFDIPWGCELAYRRDEARPAVLEVIRELRDAARAMRDTGMTSQETKYWPKVEQSA